MSPVVICAPPPRAPCRLPLASRPELGDGGNMRPVVDLLVEQVECADFVLLNKVG
jgi:G3E family GTPase